MPLQASRFRPLWHAHLMGLFYTPLAGSRAGERCIARQHAFAVHTCRYLQNLLKCWNTSACQLVGTLCSFTLLCPRRIARAGRRQASPAPTQRAAIWASSWSTGGAQRLRKQRVA